MVVYMTAKIRKFHERYACRNRMKTLTTMDRVVKKQLHQLRRVVYEDLTHDFYVTLVTNIENLISSLPNWQDPPQRSDESTDMSDAAEAAATAKANYEETLGADEAGDFADV
tara:strand:+ start:266 stop:601 length:336 start_codon:yes stop_codon:yes gene_type:complete